jgi:UDP-N-acetylglucosamine 1-carboxyvinyltransferase
VVACAIAGGEIEIHQCHPPHLQAVIEKLRETGIRIEEGPDNLRVRAPRRLCAADVTTLPHPGFPTDMQAQYMALMTQAHGTALIAETIFERRFMHVGELQRMGADIRIDGRSAVVVGPTPLTGAQVMATDLRASASLVLAGLVADGVTLIDRVYHLDRGYESMERKLAAVGASIERVR